MTSQSVVFTGSDDVTSSYNRNDPPSYSQPMLFLPPPPEHPPPSDMGSPPDSPTHDQYSNRYHGVPASVRNPLYLANVENFRVGGGSGNPCGSGYSSRNYYNDQHNGGSDRSFTSRSQYHEVGDSVCGGDTLSPCRQTPQFNHLPMSPRFRTVSPRTASAYDARTYSPHAVSEPEHGDTPPLNVYNLVTSGCVPDRELYRPYSDSEDPLVPPLRSILSSGPPSPAPCDPLRVFDPMRDQGMQSSLPSLISDATLAGARFVLRLLLIFTLTTQQNH